MVTKEEFNKVWKDSTKEDILNQFYYEHIAIRKAIECINKRKNEVDEDLWVEMRAKDYFEECDEIINILQNGSDN